MELALGALILIIILLPGISFRKGYFSAEFSNQYTIKEFFQLFGNTFIPSIVLYMAAFPFALGTGYTYDLKTLIGLLSSNDDLLPEAVKKVEEFKLQIFVFQFLINSFSFVIGSYIKNYLVAKSIDSKNEFFRYKNIWHYMLSAKFIEFERSQISLRVNKVEDVDITYIDALVNVGDTVYIYNGMLVDYQLASEGHLDFLIIQEVQRKKLGTNQFKDVNGHVVILKYDTIINLNLTFIDAHYDANGNVTFSYIS